ncbi:MAG: acyl-CoA dehydrogenase family protein [Pseudomonadales bacterium]
MALVLNEEQRFLKDTAKEFIKANSPVEALRQLRDNKDELGYDPDLWKEMAELGWAGMVLPEAYGGLDFGFLGLGAVIEEQGRNLTASPLMATISLGASILMLGGSERQKQDLLPPVAAGELTLALALEEGNHHNPEGITLSAEKNSEGYQLNGKKVFVIDGHSADKLVVAARTSGSAGETEGISLFVVDGNANGVVRQRTILADSRNSANIRFEQVNVSEEDMVGSADKGWDILEATLNRGRICLAAEMLGGALECFEQTVEYLKEREQFGVKIGTFQALKHRTAQMYIELELLKSVVLDALSAIDDDRADLPQLASLAKTLANDVYYLVTNEAVQMHGGIGVTDELEIGFYMKRSRVAIQLLGASGFHRDRYATMSGY